MLTQCTMITEGASRLATSSLVVAFLLASTAPPSWSQEPTTVGRIVREVVIYSDGPTGETETRSESELYYEPYYFSPAAKARDIAVDVAFDSSVLQTDAKGTCVEMKVNFSGANEFAQIGWVPVGATRLGQIPGLNIAEKLGAGPRDKIYLELKARRRADDQAKVSFRVGGQAGTPHKDSLRPAGTRDPDLDELTADWRTYRIPLTDKAHKLDKVLCPLCVTIEINNNRKAKKEIDSKTGAESKYVQVVLYVDDVRFIRVAEDE